MILEKMEDRESKAFCGCACFCSLLPLCSLDPSRKEEMEKTLLEMIELDGKAFAASRGKTEEDRRILEETKKGYDKVLGFLRSLSTSPMLKKKVETDIRFLENLKKNLEVAE